MEDLFPRNPFLSVSDPTPRPGHSTIRFGSLTLALFCVIGPFGGVGVPF